MCCCGKPTINGERGAFSWDGKTFMTLKPNPPELKDGDDLLYDEPGRCGGCDSHCHHVRLVKRKGSYELLVRNGCGDHRATLPHLFRLAVSSGALDAMDSNSRYWLLLSIHVAIEDSARDAAEEIRLIWTKAAAEKRIKTRKRRGRDEVTVWIHAPIRLAEYA